MTTPEIYTLSLHDALPISDQDYRERHGDPDLERSERDRGSNRRLDAEVSDHAQACVDHTGVKPPRHVDAEEERSEEHTSELQSRRDLVCRLLLEKKKI